jgi:hypothetical protein
MEVHAKGRLTRPANQPVDFARPVEHRLLIRLTLGAGKDARAPSAGQMTVLKSLPLLVGRRYLAPSLAEFATATRYAVSQGSLFGVAQFRHAMGVCSQTGFLLRYVKKSYK